jgi:serine/threonine protein kinase/Flp pilus assembly protein TadD
MFMIGKTISHYRILEKLGEGGMGVVYKAEDFKLDRLVAIKFLPRQFSFNEEEKKRFIQEAKSAASLDHSNICAIYEVDETLEGQMFMVMAYYDGETLKDKIASAPLPLPKIYDIASQIATGLQEAHENGVVHRDIKSSNIILTTKDEIKIVDFGLAKLRDQTKLTKNGTTLGTVSYMSPEQGSGEEVDQKTDIWSFGVVLYEIISGQLPFRGEYEQAIIYSILNEEAEPLDSIRSDVPKNLDKVVKKMLAKNPENRFQEMGIIIKELNNLKLELETKTSAEKSASKPGTAIAVLPFINMSADPEQEYFCDGMAEEIINALTHLENLLVIARTSAFSFKGKSVTISDIGKELKVDYILEGSVRKAGNRLRITVQLIKVDGGHHVWSQRYDRTLDDIFAIQDDISLAIVNKLKVNFLQKEKASMLKRYTENQESYNLYLNGRYHCQRLFIEGFERAIEFLLQASEKDPNFSLPYFGLGMVYMLRAYWGNMAPHDAYPTAKKYIDKALQIDPELGEALGLSAYISAFYDWHWDRASQLFRKALKLNPNSADIFWMYAEFLSVRRQHDEAISAVKKALELDPLSSFVNAQAGIIHFLAIEFEGSIEYLETAKTLSPNFFLPYLILSMLYLVTDKREEALEMTEKAFKLSGGTPIVHMYLILACLQSGHTDRAKRLIKKLKDKDEEAYVPPTLFFNIHLILKEINEAHQWLEKAGKERDSFLLWLLIAPSAFIQKIEDPRFAKTIQKYGLDL